MKNRYFLVNDGPVLDAINSNHEGIKLINKARYDFIEEIGARDEYHVYGANIRALCFDEDPGKLWKQAKRISSKAYTPRRTTKEGKALAAKISKLKHPSHRPVFEMAGMLRHQDLISGGRWYRASFGTVGDNMIVMLPFSEHSKPYKPTSEMCITEIRESEYYRMKEDVEEGM